MKLNSLSFRLIAAAAAWMLIMLPVTALLLNTHYRREAERRFDWQLDRLLLQLMAYSTGGDASRPVPPRVSIGEGLFDTPGTGWYWRIRSLDNPSEPILMSQSLTGERLELSNERDVPFDREMTRHLNIMGSDRLKLRVVERIVTFGETDTERGARYSYAVAGARADIENDVGGFQIRLFTALAVLGLGLIAGILLQVRYGLQPLKEVERGLAAIRSGEAAHLQGNLPAEITPLQLELNALIQSNQDVIERARTHVGNLAHALKTPLAVITNEAREQDSPLARKVVEQAGIMRRQVQHHLDRARVAARVRVIGGVTEVQPVAEGLIRALTRIHQDRDLDFDLACSEGLRFQGERQDLEEMLGNLMDNACKWTRGQIHVSAGPAAASPPDATGNGPWLEIVVDDDGPGLDVEQRADAVRRGRRLDETKPGSGLGLSIVADLAHLYRGMLLLDAGPQGGLRARLLLPAA